MKSLATLSLETPGAQLVLARRSGVWTFAHLGARCGAPEDLAALASARPYAANHCAEGPMETYPAFGSSRGQGHRRLGNTRGALQVRHADGDRSVDWLCTGTGMAGDRHVVLEYSDRAHPSFRAAQHFVAHADCDVFETWVAAAPKYMTEEIRIPLLRGEPGFDLDAGVWQKAARFPLVRKQGGKVTADDSGTRARMFSDGTAFWVGFEVKKDPKKIVCHTGQGVEAFPSGDEMEFLFSSDKDGYYQFAFDTRLNRYDAAVYDKSWNGDWKPMVKLTDDGWIAVVQFPFKTLGFEPIRINRVRFLPFANEWQGSPHANIHHIWGSGSTAAPEGWGELVVDIE